MSGSGAGEAPTAGQRFRELDAFRGIAALSIVLFHLISRYPQMIAGAGDPGPWISELTPLVRKIGALPVCWFFMISGFVIVWTLEKCETWRDFAVSRFSRLYPTFWAAATVTWLVGIIDPLPIQHYTTLQFFANLTMFHEVMGFPALDGTYWSLTVELIFYIGMAGLFSLGWMRHLHLVCLIWALACMGNGLLAFGGVDVWWRVQKYGLLRYGHFLIIGIMFYHIWKFYRVNVSAIIIFICIVSIYFLDGLFNTACCCVLSLMFFLAIRGHLQILVCRPLLWLGSISYALYVCHEYLGYRLLLSLENAGLARSGATAVALAAVMLLAWTITTIIERPSLLLIRAAWRRRAPMPAN